MGTYAPLVFYHVAPPARERADRELNELQAVASALDRCPPPVLDFSERYEGDRSQYLHRDRAGRFTVFQETNLLLRPVLRTIVATIGSGSLAILVFDIDELFRCNPYVASMIAVLNDRHVVQLLSIQVKTESQGIILDHCLNFERIYGKAPGFIDRVIMDNSRFCQDKSKDYINRNRHNFPEIRKLEEAAGKYVSILEMHSLLASIDPQFEKPKEPTRLTASSTRGSPDYIPYNRVR